MNFYEKTIDEKLVYKGKFIDVVNQTVELPNKRQTSRDIVRHPGGVAVLAYKDKDTILIVEQFRKPFDKVFLEIPAGKIEKGEDTESCGKRELEEETGYKARKFTYLGKIATTPGFTDEYIYIYKAEELYKGKIGGDEDEFINVKEIKKGKLKAMIKSGEIVDSKTLAALILE